ncbi:Uncharacterized protein APZ42_020979 [Daphnia magna]|uniref:Uncharacterized protein n=1 Tax=Daphnia magna TaxID=35525 RepID=A0A162CBL8_9CRUS|nr:Uncharacterized protein APZ42_020979 [Daphnia magna]
MNLQRKKYIFLKDTKKKNSSKQGKKTGMVFSVRFKTRPIPLRPISPSYFPLAFFFFFYLFPYTLG